MSGVDWPSLGREQFDRLVEVILHRLNETPAIETHHAVDGRGGDGGIDYIAVRRSEDGAAKLRTVYQLKYFPQGFPAQPKSQRDQIRESFKRAMREEPESWVLVVPNIVTPPERDFVERLRGDRNVDIAVFDRTNLDHALALNQDIWEYFRFRSADEYLFERSLLLIANPVVRKGSDLESRLRNLQRDVDAAHPWWTWDFATSRDGVTQTLRAKHPRSQAMSPIGFTLQLKQSSRQKSLVENSINYGISDSVTIAGKDIQSFRVDSDSPLFRFADTVSEVELRPANNVPGNWLDGDLVLTDGLGSATSTYLVRSRLTAEGATGFTIEVALANLVTLTFHCPNLSGASGDVQVVSAPLAGAHPDDAFDATSFLTHIAEASGLQLLTAGHSVFRTSFTPDSLGSSSTDFTQTRLLADDLRQIERVVSVRFRLPEDMTALDRVRTRNVRLMLDGRVVAHPFADTFTAPLEGARGLDIDKVLAGEFCWMLVSHNSPVERTVLGRLLELPEIRVAGLVCMTPSDAEVARHALEAGTEAGQSVTFTTRPGDRLRMFMPERARPDTSLDITPWEVPGVPQVGLS